MKLINTTNSHMQLVQSQLENTDVIFTQAPLHYELLITNKYRAIFPREIEAIRDFFLKRKIDRNTVNLEKMQTIHTDRLIEMSIPIKQ